MFVSGFDCDDDSPERLGFLYFDAPLKGVRITQMNTQRMYLRLNLTFEQTILLTDGIDEVEQALRTVRRCWLSLDRKI